MSPLFLLLMYKTFPIEAPCPADSPKTFADNFAVSQVYLYNLLAAASATASEKFASPRPRRRRSVSVPLVLLFLYQFGQPKETYSQDQKASQGNGLQLPSMPLQSQFNARFSRTFDATPSSRARRRRGFHHCQTLLYCENHIKECDDKNI